MLATLHEVLPDAKKQHYAVGLFNTVNLEMAKGVLSAAEEAKAPVIIGTAEVLLPYAELDELSYFLLPLAKKASVPVVLHYDHGLTEARVKQAIDLGFTSVMYDCSTLDFEGNCRAVAELTHYAHRRGVTVEGELGHVGANDGSAEGEAEGDHSLYTEPGEALRFAEATGVDALAVSIGTAHGAYKSKPCLDFDRLAAIASLVEPPLVLHGGSGLSDEDFHRAIQNGIAKVNIFTDINAAQAQAACGAYRPGMGMTDLMPAMVEAVKQATLTKMRLFGCVGRG